MTHDEMTCRRLILECLIDYEDGTMAEVDRIQLEGHLSHCPPCVLFIDTYRATGRTLGMLKPREIPQNLAEAVMRFVKERCGKKE
ncbi:MAG TPA: zf-HC2 domain-containing protein [Thermoanaerobaculia bacterium]|jgi:Putative zinc-finger|nr:zf-HC2 domain-containing protein [Thermoanaerobaculia bacterium]